MPGRRIEAILTTEEHIIRLSRKLMMRGGTSVQQNKTRLSAVEQMMGSFREARLTENSTPAVLGFPGQ